MSKNEIREDYFRKLKIATIFCFVLEILQIIYSALVEVILFRIDAGRFDRRKEDFGTKINLSQLRIWEMICLIVFIVLTVFIFLEMKKIKARRLPLKLIYVFYIGFYVIQTLFIFFTQDSAWGDVLFHCVLSLPAIIAIYYLFDMERNEQLNQIDK